MDEAAKNIVTILGFDPGTANMGYSTLKGLIKVPVQTSEVTLGSSFGILKTSKWQDKVEVPVRDRIDHLGLLARELIENIRPDYIAIEDFVEQGKLVGKTYKEMAFLIEHLRLLGKELKIDTSIYENKDWKKKTLKSSGVNKLQIQHYVMRKLPETAVMLGNQPDHVWDSVAIGLCKWCELTGN